MCSFLYSSKIFTEQECELHNERLQKRGPDLTYKSINEKGTFIYNVLSISSSGEFDKNFFNSDLIVFLNGEIYNCNKPTEIDFIKKLYLSKKQKFASFLDGEFAIFIYDKKNKKILLSVDAFKTKPLFYSFYKHIGISSYKGALIDSNHSNIIPMPPNTTLEFCLITKKITLFPVVNFNLRQYKNSYNDIIKCFNNAVLKRSKTDKKIFVGLSSGYDSGAIALILNKNNIKPNYFSFIQNEDKNILEKRNKILYTEFLNFNLKDKLKASCFLNKFCEKQDYTEYKFFKDSSSLLLAHMGLAARQKNCKVYLSGTGCDEIIGDYYIKGVYENSTNSCFKGKFPINLKKIFPWNNFYSGSMRNYLVKDEYIMGSLGIETRYPFLDKAFVQEFLNLKVTLKNDFYKGVLRELFLVNKFPFLENKKIGFSV